MKLNSPNRVTRRSSSTSGLLQITKSKTVTFQNSFYTKAGRTWNTIPISLRNLTLLSSFKRCLFNYYFLLTSNVYNPELPHTYKTVCVKCHKACPLDSLSDTLCRLGSSPSLKSPRDRAREIKRARGAITRESFEGETDLAHLQARQIYRPVFPPVTRHN